jgi:AmmeMemoRadiSam system protein B
MRDIRQAAVAGTWYPASGEQLALDVDRYLASAERTPRLHGLVAIIAPHAGLMYSGSVAAHAYQQLKGRSIDVIVLVGPAHAGGFDGVALYAGGGFDSPLGIAHVDSEYAARLLASPVVREDRTPHAREHSLEMQLPFVRRLAPKATIVPLLMGWQTEETARLLGQALAEAVLDRAVLLVASTDLSHYEDRATAQRLDRVVIEHVRRFDAEGLQAALTANPKHACGGGPAVAVMRAARALGARDGVVLNYADSGEVSGDTSLVVGYLAAALGSS